MTPLKSEIDLDHLMIRYQGGDLGAAAALVKELTPLLLRFLATETVSREHADDLVQEIWLRIHKIRHTYQPGGRFLPWLYSIARHVRIDHYRSVRRITKREQQVEDGFPERAEPATQSRKGELDVAALLAELPESQREVIWMLKVAGMSLNDVARATSSSVGSVKQKAHRAYTRLRDLVTVTAGETITPRRGAQP